MLFRSLEMAKRVKIVREDVVTIEYRQGVAVTASGGDEAAAGGGGRGGRGGGAGAGAPTGAGAGAAVQRQSRNIGWLKPGEQRTFTWTVKGAGPITVSIASTRGGVDSRTVTLK